MVFSHHEPLRGLQGRRVHILPKGPDAFPARPPQFTFLTANGVYEPGGKICISIGEFHAEDSAGSSGAFGWRAVLGMNGFAREVVNGMIDPEHLGGGIRILDEPPALRARRAAASVSYNRRHHADLVALFQKFEEDHPDRLVVKLRRMWRSVARVLQTDFTTVRLESLPPLFAAAFGDDWGPISLSLEHLAGVPDRRAGASLPADGQTIFLRIAPVLRDTLAVSELQVRRVLVLALHARICLEILRGEDEDYRRVRASAPQVFHEWSGFFKEGFASFLAALPGVCGRAAAPVTSVLGGVPQTPEILPKIHADLIRFLGTADIDKKMRLGEAFANRVRALITNALTESFARLELAKETTALTEPSLPEGPSVEPAVSAGAATDGHARCRRGTDVASSRRRMSPARER